MITDQPFAAWLDKNCDYKRRHVGPVRLRGKPYECEHWYFVIDDHDDGETPAIAIRVDHEERSDYMTVEIHNYDEAGNVESSCFIGLFTNVDDLETVLKVLTRVNR